MNCVKFIKLSSVKEVFASIKRDDCCIIFKNYKDLTFADINFLKNKCKVHTFYILTGKLFNKTLNHYSNVALYNEDNDEFFTPNNELTTDYQKNYLRKLIDNNKRDSRYDDDTIFLCMRMKDIGNINPICDSKIYTDDRIGLLSSLYEEAYENAGILTEKIY